MVDDDAAVVAGSDRWLEGEGEEPLARCAPMALGRLRSSRGRDRAGNQNAASGRKEAFWALDVQTTGVVLRL